MKWLKKANPVIFENQQKLEEHSKELYTKMRHRRLLKERKIIADDSLNDSKWSFE